ncbi:MAG: right-handed parallel beta-helix repeat-containing protein, partial [Methanobrevibacter sp.]|nr:right-handed parallel beta-helix repeat-containing protein [Methanobrevibacter sp.]
MKNKFLVLCLVICVVFSMQAIAAENVDADVLNQTDQLSVDDVDGDVLQVADEGQDVLTLDDEIPWSEETVVRVSGGNFSKLNNVIQNAANNSVIILEGDFTFDEDKDVSGAIHLTDKSIIIDGLGHTIDAKNETRIFWFENGNFTVIKNIVFKNAYNPSSDNSYTGGALSLVGNGRVLNCTFLNNSAGMAGALYWGYANQAQIFNCTFENNSALSAGGGAIRIRNNMTNVVIENSTFINNYAPTDGGAIHLANTQGSRSNSIINCTFINNTAASGGGAVLVQAPGCNVTNSTFINNSATLGGAMRWAGYSGTIRNTTFTTNHASSQGGAMHGTGDQPIVILSHFNNNTAPDGGAIWWGDTENGIITNSTFDYNIATGNAGAIHISGTLCNITYSNFTHNEANNGASIFLDVGAYISECLFEHERAYNDGGAIYLNSVDIDMSQIPQSVLAMLGLFNSTLYNCSAGNDGGAGYIRASGG